MTLMTDEHREFLTKNQMTLSKPVNDANLEPFIAALQGVGALSDEEVATIKNNNVNKTPFQKFITIVGYIRSGNGDNFAHFFTQYGACINSSHGLEVQLAQLGNPPVNEVDQDDGEQRPDYYS